MKIINQYPKNVLVKPQKNYIKPITINIEGITQLYHFLSFYFHNKFTLNNPGITRITKLPAKLLVTSNTSLTSVTKKLIINMIAIIQNTIKYLAQVGVGLLVNIKHSIYFLHPKHVVGK